MWTKIRINPEDLPTGKLKVIPSFFYLRLKHKETQAYFCDAKLTEEKTTSTYEMNYAGLKRKVAITFENEFPYKILGWTESYPDGWAVDSPLLTTEASVLNTIQSDYWNKNRARVYDPDLENSVSGFNDLYIKKTATLKHSGKAGIVCIANGMNYNVYNEIDISKQELGLQISMRNLCDKFLYDRRNKIKQWKAAVKNQLSAYDWLSKHIYNNKEH